MTTPSKPYHLLNIGLTRTHEGNLDLMPADYAMRAVDDVVPVLAHAVHQSSTEPTLVLQIERPLPPSELHRLAMRLGQEAIAQYTNGGGSLEGPGAAEWGAFDPARFLMLDGSRAGVPEATLSPTESVLLQLLKAAQRVKPILADCRDDRRPAAFSELCDAIEAAERVL